MTRLLTLASLVAGATSLVAAEPPKFELQDGDRVVFLGNTLIEREQKYGYWELMLTMAWPERNVTFRNLGWSGDTVWGESRAGFGTQADGFKKLVDEVNAARPTVIFVGYGNVEAFDGAQGLPKFVEGYNRLLDELEKTKARIVVLGPIYQNRHLTPNRDWPRVNESIGSYSDAIAMQCERRAVAYISLTSASTMLYDHDPATADGEAAVLSNREGDLTAAGYLLLFRRGMANKLGVPSTLFVPTSPEGAENFVALIHSIKRKNELFYHRWRPQNETYLFGFRKHEQGNNAKEVFEFDPLVAAEEKKIAELRGKLAAEWKEARDAK